MWSFASPWAFLALPLPLLAMHFLPETRTAAGALRVPAGIGTRLAEGEGRGIRARTERWLPLLLWVSLVLALAGPQRVAPTPALPASGRDLVLAIDLSGSMEREDFELDGEAVSRLDAVKRTAAAFVRGRAGDRVGLVIFGEEAYFAAPPTFDVEAVARTVEEATIGISGRSTAIADGLGLALKRLAASDARSRVVILLSDGVDNAGTVEPVATAALAADLGIRVHTVALGPNDLADPGTDRDVVDTATLQAVAQASGGTNFRVRDTADLVAVGQAIDRLEASAFEQPATQIYRPYWIYPAVFALLVAGVIGGAEGRRR